MAGGPSFTVRRTVRFQPACHQDRKNPRNPGAQQNISFKLRSGLCPASSCGVVRLSILPSQGSDLGFKSRREHCFTDSFPRPSVRPFPPPRGRAGGPHRHGGRGPYGPHRHLPERGGRGTAPAPPWGGGGIRRGAAARHRAIAAPPAENAAGCRQDLITNIGVF